MTTPIRIANCSGFFGDRPSGAREMVDGGPIDVLTGDWLAELTMFILSRTRERGSGGGYAWTFVQQMEEVMGTCLDRGIKVVSNAGGLDPAACAGAIAEVAARLGLSPSVAWVDGDDLMPRVEELLASGGLAPFEPGDDLRPASEYVTANAYLGCFGIVEALGGGADIVITGRVTDAALTCGPAAWHHQWDRSDFDQLAGAVVAGHVIECSAQATGGNYSFFTEIDGYDDPARVRLGFPWAEVAADGSSIIGKHDGTGGAVTVGTVTSQLLYEIGGPEYLGPDVTARFDSIEVTEVDRDRVRISGVRGQPPPESLKVAMNRVGGYRNTASVAITGIDARAKARMVEATFWDSLGSDPAGFGSVETRWSAPTDHDPDTQEAATSVWSVTVKDTDRTRVDRSFADAAVHTALSSIPGMYMPGGPPGPAAAYGVYQPARIHAAHVPQFVHFPDALVIRVDSVAPAGPPVDVSTAPPAPPPGGPTTPAAVGTVVGTRSGDKGGHANLGLFVRTDPAFRWLDAEFTVARVRELLPEVADLAIERHRLPRIRSLNFVIRGLLGEGVAETSRPDAQAKALGEWLRARVIEVPDVVLRGGTIT